MQHRPLLHHRRRLTTLLIFILAAFGPAIIISALAVGCAFHTPAAWRARVEGRRMLIIDDVLTTGATVEGCARALKAAGASGVDVAVIARVKQLTPRSI